MKVSYEVDLENFEAWSGGADTLDSLTHDQIRCLESQLDDIFGYEESIDETELNDFLWFERDLIAECLGFKDWEHLERFNDGLTEDDEDDEEDDDEEDDDEEDEE